MATACIGVAAFEMQMPWPEMEHWGYSLPVSWNMDREEVVVMSGEIRMLTEDSFHAQIATGTTLVDFYADWCGPCRMLAPVLEQVAKDVSGKATVAKLDVDKAQTVASTYQVTSIPTLILFRDGKEVNRLVGMRDAESIKEILP